MSRDFEPFQFYPIGQTDVAGMQVKHPTGGVVMVRVVKRGDDLLVPLRDVSDASGILRTRIDALFAPYKNQLTEEEAHSLSMLSDRTKSRNAVMTHDLIRVLKSLNLDAPFSEALVRLGASEDSRVSETYQYKGVSRKRPTDGPMSEERARNTIGALRIPSEAEMISAMARETESEMAREAERRSANREQIVPDTALLGEAVAGLLTMHGRFSTPRARLGLRDAVAALHRAVEELISA